MTTSSLNYIRQNAVAFLALFIALSGTAFAAVNLPRNSVGNKQLKKNAVTGKKVKRNTLTGVQINESKLGVVPNSTRLGGQPASAFLGAGATAANADKLDGVDSAVFGSALTVPGSTFAPRDMSGSTTKTYQSTGSISATGGTTDFHKSVVLPQGATITGLDYRFVDNNGGSDSGLSLIAFNSIGAGSSESITVVSAASSGASAGRRNSSGTPGSAHVVDNSTWSYVLVWSPFDDGSDTQLVGGRINYAVPRS